MDRLLRWWAHWFGPQEIEFPAGTILLPGPLVVRGRVRLVGSGRPATAGDGATDDVAALEAAMRSTAS